MERYFEVNAAGHNIRCKLYCADPRSLRAIVISVNGFGGHRDNHAASRFAEWMISKHKGTALVAFDLPCHGSDVKKKLLLSDCDAYIGLLLADLREKYPDADFYAYSTSFGGYLTLKYISDHGNPFRKVALRCPAIAMYDVFSASIIKKDDAEKLRKGKDVLAGFDRKVPVNAQFLADLHSADLRQRDFIPWAEDIFICHGTKDEVVPWGDSEAFCDANIIEFLPIEGADHRFQNPKHMDAAVKASLEFFAL